MTPPQQATYAQVLLYTEALGRVNNATKPEPAKPRRLKGNRKKEFYEAIERGDH